MTSLRKLEEEAARTADPAVRAQLHTLIEKRRQQRKDLWVRTVDVVRNEFPDDEPWYSYPLVYGGTALVLSVLGLGVYFLFEGFMIVLDWFFTAVGLV